MPKEIGLMLSTPMVLAYMHGGKTQTRRTHGLNLINQNPDEWELVKNQTFSGYWYFKDKKTSGIIEIKCPLGQVGDEIYWKETWATEYRYNYLKPSEIPLTAKIWYLADGYYNPQVMGNVRSSMFMPKEASRYRHIPILNIGCQRVQDISEDDAIAEGAELGSARGHYSILWDNINKNQKWDTSPWCFAYTFPAYKGGK